MSLHTVSARTIELSLERETQAREPTAHLKQQA